MAQLGGGKLEGPKGEEEFLSRCAVKFVSTIFEDAVNDMRIGTVIGPEGEGDDEYEEVWDLASEDDVEDLVAQAMALIHGDMAPSAGKMEVSQLMQEEDATEIEDHGQEEVYEAEDFVLDYICGLLDDEINDAAVVAELVGAPACRRPKSDPTHVEMALPHPTAGGTPQAPTCAAVFSVPELLRQPGPGPAAGGAAGPTTPQTSMEALVGCSGPAGTHTAEKPTAQDSPLFATTGLPGKSAAPAVDPTPAKGTPDRNAGLTSTATLVTSASSPALQPARPHASRPRRRVIGGVVRAPAASEEVSCSPRASKDLGARACRPHRRSTQEKALDAVLLRRPSTPPWAPPFSSDRHGSLAKLSKVSSAMSLDLNGDLPSKPCSHVGLSKDLAPQRRPGVSPTFARSLSVGAIQFTTKDIAERSSTLPRFKVSDSVFLPAIAGSAQGASGSIAWNRHKAKSTKKGFDLNQDLRLGKQHDAPMSLPWAVL